MHISIILAIAAYLLFNTVILLCDTEGELSTTTKVIVLFLGLPIAVIVFAVQFVEGFKEGWRKK